MGYGKIKRFVVIDKTPLERNGYVPLLGIKLQETIYHSLGIKWQTWDGTWWGIWGEYAEGKRNRALSTIIRLIIHGPPTILGLSSETKSSFLIE